MKLKATKQAIKSGYHKIISIGYCDAQNLLAYQEPFAYSEGVYGWSCDYYNINGVCISTGYSPLDDKNVNHDYNVLKEYDKKASAIRYNYDMEYEQKKDAVNALLLEFVKAV